MKFLKKNRTFSFFVLLLSLAVSDAQSQAQTGSKRVKENFDEKTLTGILM